MRRKLSDADTSAQVGMNCRKAKKLINRMLDGDLSSSEQSAVSEHLRTCGECAKYYQDMAAICGAARVLDREPPVGFRSGWKRAVDRARTGQTRASRRRGYRWKPQRAIPALACGILGVFVISIAVTNPQAFGLGGESLRSEQATVMPSETTAPSIEPTEFPIIFGNVVVPTRIPKPATQDDEYWEETVWSTAAPSQVVTGDIEGLSAEMDDAEAETSAPEENSFEPDSELPFELIVPGAATIASMRSFADTTEGFTVAEQEDGILVEASPELIALFLNAFGLEGPDGAARLHIACQNAG